MQSGKNIGSMRTKGVNVKIIPQCTTFHEILQILKYTSAMVTEFWLFNRIKEISRHILHHIKFLLRVNFRGDLHLDVSKC